MFWWLALYRYRARCEFARRHGKAVPEVIPPLEPALFRGTSYGLSVSVTLLIQVYWQRRPVRAFEREWADCGVGPTGGHASGTFGGFPDLVRATGRGDRGASEAGSDRARGRDLMGGACVGGFGGEPAQLDVGVPEHGRGPLSGGPVLYSTPAFRQSKRVAGYIFNLPVSCLDNRDHLSEPVQFQTES